jgi:hypothetical protein
MLLAGGVPSPSGSSVVGTPWEIVEPETEVDRCGWHAGSSAGYLQKKGG